MHKIFVILAGTLAMGLAILSSDAVHAAPNMMIGNAEAVATTSKSAQGIDMAQRRVDPRDDRRLDRRPPPPPRHARPTQKRRCWTENKRVWSGHRWVRRPVRVCR